MGLNESRQYQVFGVETRETTDLGERLRNCRLFCFDAIGTLVYTEPDYYQTMTKEVLLSMGYSSVSDELIGSIRNSNDIYGLLNTLSIDNTAFRLAYNQRDLPEKRLKQTHCYDDVYKLSALSDRMLCLVTQASPALAYAYAGLIAEKGVEIPFIQTPYFYPVSDQEQLRKPNPKLITDLIRIMSLLPMDQDQVQNVCRRTVIIGDSREDLELAHNIGAVPVLITRDRKDTPDTDFTYLKFPDLTQFVKAVQGIPADKQVL